MEFAAGNRQALGGDACDASHRLGKREAVNAPDKVDDISALTTSIANPPAGPTVDVQIWTPPINMKRAATYERGTRASQFDTVGTDKLIDGMIASKTFSVDDGPHMAVPAASSL